MSQPIVVPQELADGDGTLLLNPGATRVAVVSTQPRTHRHAVAVYDVADGRLIGGPFDLGAHECAGFLDDDTLLFAVEGDVLRWRATGAVELVQSVPGVIEALACAPGPDRIAYVLRHQEPQQFGWRMAALSELGADEQSWEIFTPFSNVHFGKLAFAPGSRFVVVELIEGGGSENYGLLLCDAATGRRVQTFYTRGGLGSAAFANGEAFVVAADGELDVHERASADAVRTLELPDDLGQSTAVGFGPDGSWLRVIAPGGVWARVDLATGAVVETGELPVPLATYYNLAFTADGRAAAGVTEDNTVAVFAFDDEPERGRRDPRES